jgi:hypothetical protein
MRGKKDFIFFYLQLLVPDSGSSEEDVEGEIEGQVPASNFST